MARIRLRRDSSTAWVATNPILSEGEPGYENDTGKFKIGDGLSTWLDLGYFSPSGVIYDPTTQQALALVQAHISSSTPHAIYDDGPSLVLLYLNAKV